MTTNPDKLPLSRGQVILRIIGGLFLTICALMVVLGLTVLDAWLRGPRYLVYWTACMLITLGALGAALWDMLLVRRISRKTRRELFHQEFMTEELRSKLRDRDNR